MGSLIILDRKLHLRRIPMPPEPAAASNDQHGFACLPPSAWIAVLQDRDGQLVCHDAHRLAATQYATPVPRPVSAILDEGPAPCLHVRHVDLKELGAFLPAHSMRELDALFDVSQQ